MTQTMAITLKHRSGQFQNAQSRVIPIHMGNLKNMRRDLHAIVDQFCDDSEFPQTKKGEAIEGLSGNAVLSEAGTTGLQR